MNYSVTLDLKGNILEKLNLVDSKLSSINRKSRNVRVSGVGGANSSHASRYIPDDMYRRLTGFRYRFRHNRYFNFDETERRLERAYRARSRFVNNFWSNSTYISGARRNFGNFLVMFNEFSSTLLRTIPALGTVVKSLGAIFGINAAQIVGGGLLYKFGKRSLMSESMNTAIQNSATYDMVRLTRGKDFNNLYNTATRISETTGAGRAGSMALLNTLSGLNIGNTRLNDRDAAFFANAAARISAMSGRDMNIVGLNLQQLLTTWQGIDMKELFKSVPIIEKYVLDLRANAKNKGDNIYSFIRENPQALVDAFAKLIESYQLGDVAIAKGRMQLSEEQLSLTKMKALEKFYVGVSEVSIGINKMLEKLYTELGKVDWTPLLRTFEDFMSGIINFATSFAKFLQSDEFKRISNIISGAIKGAGAGGILGSVIPGLGTAVGIGAGGIIGSVGGYFSDIDAYSTEQKELYSRLYNNSLLKNILTKSGFKSNSLFRDEEGKLRYSSVNISPSTIKLSKEEYNKLIEKLSFGSRGYNAMGYDILKGGNFEEAVRNILAGTDSYKPTITSAAGNETGKMEKLTRGSRSLIINFNKSVVEMINNMQPNDTESLLKEMETMAEDAVARGLHIAFNNATLAATSQ